jgi:hypothetical protein
LKIYLKNIILYALSILLGGLFIISAYFKIIEIELFELNLVDTGLVGWNFAKWMALLIISSELFSGLLIMLNFRLRQFTLLLSSGLLLIFTFYLLGLLLTRGNQENCNCFGSLIMMNPIESILKNIFLLVISFILYRYHKGLEWEYPKLMVLGTIIISFGIPLALDLVTASSANQSVQTTTSRKIDLNMLYSGSTFTKPSQEIRKGKHIVAFFSLTCPSCLMAAYKFSIIKKTNPAIPVYFILFGKVEEISQFLAKTKSYSIPHTLLLTKDFIKLVGSEVPVIVYLENGVVKNEISFLQIDQKDIENWLSTGSAFSGARK